MWRYVLAGILVLVWYVPAYATDVRFIKTSIFPKVFEQWFGFCRRFPKECEIEFSAPRVHLRPGDWETIQNINTYVNTFIIPTSDPEHWGVRDRWDIPTDRRGDCEEYVLLKRKLLIEMGYPRSALRIAHVLDRGGEGHGLLIVRSTEGDFVLDNIRHEVVLWAHSGYKFLNLQSGLFPELWFGVIPVARERLAVR